MPEKDFFHLRVRPKLKPVATIDVGRKGHMKIRIGRLKTGASRISTALLSKKDWKKANGKLTPITSIGRLEKKVLLRKAGEQTQIIRRRIK